MNATDNYLIQELQIHIAHNVAVVTYGTALEILNVALECYDCHKVILDYDL